MDASPFYWETFVSLERPLQRQGGVDERVAVVVGVEDEVVADFHLGADAEVDTFESLEGVEVVPELWLTLDNE